MSEELSGYDEDRLNAAELIQELPPEGCQDSLCDVRQNVGQCTNGGCRCDKYTVRRALRWYRSKYEATPAREIEIHNAAVERCIGLIKRGFGHSDLKTLLKPTPAKEQDNV